MKRRTPIQIPRDPGYEVGSASPGIWPVAADGTVTRHFSAYSRHITTLRAAVEITFFLLVIGFIVLFGFAGTDKVTHLAKFQDGLKNSPFIPVWAAWLFAYAVIASFFAIAISLLIGFWKPKIITIGLWLATGLLLIFTLYIAAIVTGITYKPCTCIGLDEKLGLGWGAHLLLNGALLAVAWLTTLMNYAYKILFAIGEAPSQPLKNGKFRKERRYETMVKKMMSFVAVAALALTIGFKLVQASNAQQYIWVYEDGTTTTGTPDCIDAPVACAYQHYFDSSQENNVGEPVYDENDEPVKVDGVKRTQ